ncbi:hypothetical protein SpCBS45565_g02287 [Spizellomyces sp. 'palustris']|nr:hypothetical protein SpCBS45565_g02287 [Spizellomyces sp. 'palustris']
MDYDEFDYTDTVEENEEPSFGLSMPKEVTVQDVQVGKVDIQGIDWSQLPIPRDKFRESRVRNYGNYKNMSIAQDAILDEMLTVRRDGSYYGFRHAQLHSKCHIVHFQLRNLLWATSKNDVFYTNRHGVCHWCPVSKTTRMALDLKKHDMGGMKVSSMVAKEGLLMVGGFSGEYICRRLDSRATIWKGCVTTDPNGITNHMDIFESRSGAKQAIISSNDERTRIMDAKTMQVQKTLTFKWPINCTTLSPDRRMLCVVGDNPNTLIVDSEAGEHLATLKGHIDYSFACAWSPCGRLVATGNQDMTTRIYDTRNLSHTLAVLPAIMGAVRSIRFSDDGRHMVFAEPADFVHVVDLTSAPTEIIRGPYGSIMSPDSAYRTQVVDFFGEIAGVSFTPGGSGDGADGLFVGIADPKYG